MGTMEPTAVQGMDSSELRIMMLQRCNLSGRVQERL